MRMQQSRHSPLLAVGAVHHHLIERGVRSNVGLIVETGDARSTHHIASLIGYGANAVNPFMVYDILRHALRSGRTEETAVKPGSKDISSAWTITATPSAKGC